MVGLDQRKPSPSSFLGLAPAARRVVLAGVLGVIGLALAACGTGQTEGRLPGVFPVEPATEQGLETYTLYPIVFWIAVAVFVLVEGWLIWIALRYRRRRGDDSLPAQTHGHNGLEVIWTLVPALIVTGLFLGTVDRLGRIEHLVDQPDVVIDVIAFQWQWQFDYPNEGLSFIGSGKVGPVMAMPTNERVRIRLQARDVIHAFYVPQFLYKRDAIPGRTNEFEVVVTEPGTYGGQCAEFCGLAHADMFFTVEAMSRADYDAWVAERQDEANQTPPPAGDGQTIELTAVDAFTFRPATLQAQADVPIIFQFQNADTLQPHDVSIEGAGEGGAAWVGAPFTGPGQSSTYSAPALAAGEYEFFCSIHPTTMRGTLTVSP